MKLKAILKEKERSIEIMRDGESVSASVDGIEKTFEVTEPEPGCYLFKSPDGVFESYVSRSSSDGPILVSVGQEEFEVVILDPKRLRGSSAGSGAEDGPVQIKSAMPGKIVRVIAREGDKVKFGDGIVVVEAMKMQNELKSPKDGIVSEMRVNEDDRVNSGDVLAVVT